MERYGWSNVDKYVEKRLCRWGDALAMIEAGILLILDAYRFAAPKADA